MRHIVFRVFGFLLLLSLTLSLIKPAMSQAPIQLSMDPDPGVENPSNSPNVRFTVTGCPANANVSFQWKKEGVDGRTIQANAQGAAELTHYFSKGTYTMDVSCGNEDRHKAFRQFLVVDNNLDDCIATYTPAFPNTESQFTITIKNTVQGHTYYVDVRDTATPTTKFYEDTQTSSSDGQTLTYSMSFAGMDLPVLNAPSFGVQGAYLTLTAYDQSTQDEDGCFIPDTTGNDTEEPFKEIFVPLPAGQLATPTPTPTPSFPYTCPGFIGESPKPASTEDDIEIKFDRKGDSATFFKILIDGGYEKILQPTESSYVVGKLPEGNYTLTIAAIKPPSETAEPICREANFEVFSPDEVENFNALPESKPGGTACDYMPLGKCEEVLTAFGLIQTDPLEFITNIFAILLSLAGGIALLLIIFSGYRMLASRGNPEAIGAAKERLTSAIVGLLFIIFSFVILELVGVNILQIPGFESGGENTQSPSSPSTPGNSKQACIQPPGEAGGACPDGSTNYACGYCTSDTGCPLCSPTRGCSTDVYSIASCSSGTCTEDADCSNRTPSCPAGQIGRMACQGGGCVTVSCQGVPIERPFGF